MINQQLLDYISRQQEAGSDDDTIKANLTEAGWREEDVEEGFQAVEAKGDGNSTAAHQEVRAEASKERSQGQADGIDSADEASEPKEVADNSTLGPIDEKAGDDSAAQPRKVSDDNENEEDAGPVAEADTSIADNSATDTGEPSAAEQTKDSNDIKDPLTENAKLAELGKQDKASSGNNSDDIGPMSVRTYQQDKARASGGGNQAALHPKHKADQKSPEQKADKKEASSREQSNQSTQKTQPAKKTSGKSIEEATSQAREKKAKEKKSASRNKPKKKSSVQKRDQVMPKKAAAAGVMASSAAGKSKEERQTSDGRQRFSANKDDVAGAKKRAAARQKKRSKSSSSGSNLVSILIFIFALILVGGGGVYAYVTYFQTDVPTATAADVMDSLTAAETFDFRFTIESASGTTTTGRKIIEGAVDLDQNTEAESYYTLTGSNQTAPPLRAVMAEIENIAAVPAEQRATVSDIVLTPQFFSVGEFQTTELLGQSEGFMTNRFSISADSTKLVADYATLHQALFNDPLSADVLNNLQATVAGFSTTQGQVWLDTETGVPYQITFIGTNAAGEDTQVNLQFKNHGAALESTPPYEPRSLERVLSQYFSTNGAAAEPTATTSDDPTPDEGTEPVAEPEDSSTSPVEIARRQDQLRINDIQQLTVALRLYANDTGDFPPTLSALSASDAVVFSSIPRDPVTDNAYSYSVSGDAERYHLGATLRQLRRADLSGDANFNSRGQGYTDGFNGAAAGCQPEEADPAATCYDVTATVE
jgi:hypothetical protein